MELNQRLQFIQIIYLNLLFERYIVVTQDASFRNSHSKETEKAFTGALKRGHTQYKYAFYDIQIY
jgi:hypothetical protein